MAPDEDPFPEFKAGLLPDYAIWGYVAEVGLMENAVRASLRPTNYDLRIGEEYYVAGKYHRLSDQDPDLVIPPHQVVVLSILEKLNMPKYLVGRWNIRVRLLYRGLILVSGPQVDPGFKGRLNCTVFNFSTTPIRLRFGEEFATIEFQKIEERASVEKYANEKLKTYLNDPDLVTREPGPNRPMSYYLPPYVLESAPAEFNKQISDLREQLRQFQTYVLGLIGILFAGMSVLIAIVAR